MIYKKYGTTFRILREQHQFKLDNFSSVGVSKSTLSKFERGEAMISLQKIVAALQLMGITLEEYEHFLNEYSPSDIEILIDKINVAYRKLDIQKLKTLYNDSLTMGFPQLALASKSCYAPLSDEEIEYITSYLYEIKIWSIKDLWTFCLTLENFNVKDIIKISDFFLSSGHKIINSQKYREILILSCCRASAYLSSKGYKDASKYIIDRSAKYNLINTMFFQNLCNGVQGIWVYYFENQEKGQEQINTTLKNIIDLTSYNFSNFYIRQFNEKLKK